MRDSRRLAVIAIDTCLITTAVSAAPYSVVSELSSLRERMYVEKLSQLGIALRLVTKCLDTVIYGVEHLGEANASEIAIYISQNLYHAQNYLYFEDIPSESKRSILQYAPQNIVYGQ